MGPEKYSFSTLSRTVASRISARRFANRGDARKSSVSVQNMSSSVPYYKDLTPEERTRMAPLIKIRCVMMSSEAPPPPLQASIPSIGFDVPDEVSSNKIRPATPIASIKPSSPETEDTEVIEEALPIVRTTLPMPEPQPKIEMNGFDMDVNDGAREKGGGREEELGLGIAKKDKSQTEDDSCLVNCIYFAQQCCECTIL